MASEGEADVLDRDRRGQGVFASTPDQIRSAEESFSKALNRKIESVLTVPEREPTPTHQEATDLASKAGIGTVYFDSDDPTMAFVGGLMDHKSKPPTMYVNAGEHLPGPATVGHELTHHLSRVAPEVYKNLTESLKPHIKGLNDFLRRLKTARSEIGLSSLSRKLMEQEYYATVVGELRFPGQPYPEYFHPSGYISNREAARTVLDKALDDFFGREPVEVKEAPVKPVKPVKPAKPPQYTLTEDQEYMLNEAINDLVSAQGPVLGTEATEHISFGTGNPPWFVENRASWGKSKAQAIKILEKAIRGEKLGVAERRVLSDVLAGKEKEWDTLHGDEWRKEGTEEPPFALHKPEFHSEDYNEAVTRTAENAIDKVIAYATERFKSEKGGVPVEDIGNWLTEVRQKLHDAVTIDAIPRLTRASAPMAMLGIEHAASRIAGPRIARALIANVLPEMYKFPEQLERFADLLVKDNILDIHDAFTTRALEANFKANDVIKSSWDGFKNEIAQAYEKAERAAARAKTDAGRDQARKFLDKAEAMEKELADAMKKFKPIGKLAGEEKEHLREAKKWLELSKNVTKLHDIDQYHIDVQEALQDPMMANAASRWTKIMNPYLDKLYLENKDLDPNTPAEGRGFYTKARVNLITLDQEAKWEASKADMKNPMPVQGHWGNYRNPDMKAVAFDKMAKGTGEYSRNLENILLNVIGRRWQDVTKRRFYEQIVQSGNGMWLEEGMERPTEIQGERAVALPVKIIKTSKDGKSTPRPTTLYIRESLAEETRRILDTDMRGPDGRIMRFLTAIQLAQLADATTHGKNVLSVVSAALAQASKVSMLKGFGVYDAVKRIAQVIEEVQSDTPEIRAEIADMAVKGMIREEYPHGGLIRQKIPIVKDIPHWLIVQDTAARIIMRRLYKDFVKNGLFPDDPIKEFNYVMQVGQYNRRLMGFYMQKMKDAGLSPFIVAGRNFNRQGRRLVTGYPGSETTGWQAELQMRATNLMRIGLLGLAPMIANTFITGSPMGRPGTPVFAVDLGKEEDDKGKHKVFDLAQLIGLRRGMRATGIEALVEGGIAGHSLDQIATKAGTDIYQTMFHPWAGPGVGFLAKATGKQFDIRGEMQAQKIPGGGTAQVIENLRAGLEAQNPFFYSVMRPALVSAGIDQKPDKPYVQDFLEQTFLQPLFRPIGIKDQYPSMSAAELLARTFIQQSFPEGMTPEQQRMNEQKIRLRGALRRGEDIEDLVSEGMETGGLSTKQIANIVRGSGRENIINLIDVIHDPKSVMRVFQVATDDEKDLMRDLIEGKLARSTKLTQDEKEAYKEIMDRE